MHSPLRRCKIRAFPLLLLLVVPVAVEAQNQTPPNDPRPRPPEPSLDETLKFVVDSVAHMNFTVSLSVTNTNDGQSYSDSRQVWASNIQRASNQCDLSYTLVNQRVGTNRPLARGPRGEVWYWAIGGQSLDMRLSLSNVENVSAEPYEQYMSTDVRNESADYTPTATSPPTTIVLVRQRQNAAAVFGFVDKSLAERFTTAIARAARLCGGGVPQ